MRKFIIGIFAIAMLAIPSVAAADVPRCDAPVTSPTTVQFTVTEPANAEHQFDNVWTDTYTVDVQPNGTFVGTGEITGSDANGTYDQQVPAHTGADENIVGTFSEANTVSYVSTRSDGLHYVVNDAPTNGSLFTDAKVAEGSPWSFEIKVTAPPFTTLTESVKNHGQYVKAQGGGKDERRRAPGCRSTPRRAARSNNTHDTDGLASAGPAPRQRPPAYTQRGALFLGQHGSLVRSPSHAVPGRDRPSPEGGQVPAGADLERPRRDDSVISVDRRCRCVECATLNPNCGAP